MYYPDLNGRFEISNTDVANPWWQGEYVNVHFTFVPANKQPFPGKEVFVWGDCTQLLAPEKTRMDWNGEKGLYEKTILLKQGYYSYQYLARDIRTPNVLPDPIFTEGNYFEAENEYLILYYYRSFSSRYDELMGIQRVQAGANITR